jgi:hypothetical protein
MRPDTDAPKNDDPVRDPPRRYIDKKEGIRHVLPRTAGTPQGGVMAP